MKKSRGFVLSLILVSILLLSFASVSAFSWSSLWDKLAGQNSPVTGNAIASLGGNWSYIDETPTFNASIQRYSSGGGLFVNGDYYKNGVLVSNPGSYGNGGSNGWISLTGTYLLGNAGSFISYSKNYYASSSSNYVWFNNSYQYFSSITIYKSASEYYTLPGNWVWVADNWRTDSSLFNTNGASGGAGVGTVNLAATVTSKGSGQYLVNGTTTILDASTVRVLYGKIYINGNYYHGASAVTNPGTYGSESTTNSGYLTLSGATISGISSSSIFYNADNYISMCSSSGGWNYFDQNYMYLKNIYIWVGSDYYVLPGNWIMASELSYYDMALYKGGSTSGTCAGGSSSNNCTVSDWSCTNSSCNASNYLTRTCNKLSTSTCSGGVSYAASEVLSCNYSATLSGHGAVPTFTGAGSCGNGTWSTSFNGTWGECNATSGLKSRRLSQTCTADSCGNNCTVSSGWSGTSLIQVKIENATCNSSDYGSAGSSGLVIPVGLNVDASSINTGDSQTTTGDSSSAESSTSSGSSKVYLIVLIIIVILIILVIVGIFLLRKKNPTINSNPQIPPRNPTMPLNMQRNPGVNPNNRNIR